MAIRINIWSRLLLLLSCSHSLDLFQPKTWFQYRFDAEGGVSPFVFIFFSIGPKARTSEKILTRISLTDTVETTCVIVSQSVVAKSEDCQKMNEIEPKRSRRRKAIVNIQIQPDDVSFLNLFKLLNIEQTAHTHTRHIACIGIGIGIGLIHQRNHLSIFYEADGKNWCLHVLEILIRICRFREMLDKKVRFFSKSGKVWNKFRIPS